MSVALRTGLFGLGQIGAINDIANPAPVSVRSHLGAMLASGMSPQMLVDPDERVRVQVANHYPSLATRLFPKAPDDGENLDLIAIAGPTDIRLLQVQEALHWRPRWLIVEKPLAPSEQEALELVELCKNNQCHLRVNFQRSLDPRHQQLKEFLGPAKNWKIHANISHGWFHFGAHLIDLLLDFCGDVCELQAWSAGPGKIDPLLDAILHFKNGCRAFIAGKEMAPGALFEVSIVTDRGVATIGQGGASIFWQEIEPEPIYPGYPQLSLAKKWAEPQQMSGLLELYQAIGQNPDEPLRVAGCDAKRALAGMKILEMAAKAAQSQPGAVVKISSLGEL